MGRAREAVTALEKSIRLMPDSTLPQYALCFALVAAGREAEAREVLNELKKAAEKGYVKPYFLAMAHVALDERDAAFELFERAFAERDHWLVWFGTEPKLDPLRRDPRFNKLFRQMKNPLAFSPDTSPNVVESTGDAPPTKVHTRPLPARFERRKVGALVALALIVLAAVAAIGYFSLRSQPQRKITAIAVLPIANATGSSELDYLGDGITESLIDNLSQLPEMKVIARSSSFRYKGKEVDTSEAAKALGVGAVVRGRMVRVGEQLQISVELAAADGQQFWSKQYSAIPEDPLRVQAEISREIAGVLTPQLTADQRQQFVRPGTANTQAYHSFIRGRFYWNKNGAENWKKAIELYGQAVAADPAYADAYAELSGTHRLLAVTDGPALKSSWRKAEAMGSRLWN